MNIYRIKIHNEDGLHELLYRNKTNASVEFQKWINTKNKDYCVEFEQISANKIRYLTKWDDDYVEVSFDEIPLETIFHD